MNALRKIQFHPKLLVAVLFVLTLAVAFRPPSRLDRILEQDEILTLRATSVGWPENMEESRGKLRGDVRSLGIGLIRSMADEWTPNNQMVNSWLTSLSVFVFGVSESSVRYASLASFLASLAIFAVLVFRLSGSYPLTAILGALYASHPFFIYQSMSCRGYTAASALFLVAIAILTSDKQSKSDPLYRLFALVVICNLLFLNLVSLLFTWIAPLFISIWLFPPERFVDSQSKPPAKWHFRWTWTCLFFLCIFACGTFVAAKFRDFLVTQEKYGEPVSGFVAVTQQYGAIWNGFFPSWQAVVGVMSVLAFVILLRQRNYRWFAALALTSVLLSLFYTAATRKVPYARTYIIFFPVLLLSIAAVWKVLQSSRRLQNAILFILASIFLLSLPESWASSRKVDSSYASLARRVSIALKEQPPGHSRVAVKPWVWDVDLYLSGASTVRPIPTGATGLIDVVIMGEKPGASPLIRAAYWDRAKKEFNMGKLSTTLASDILAQDGIYFASKTTCSFREWEPGSPLALSERTPLLIWQDGSLPGTADEVLKLLSTIKADVANYDDYKFIVQYSKIGVTGFLFLNPDKPDVSALPVIQSVVQQGGGKWFAVEPKSE